MMLNEAALGIVEELVGNSEQLKVAVRFLECGARVVDCGIEVDGGLEAGCLLAEICLGNQGTVTFTPSRSASIGVDISVGTDQPLRGCMASQYAGWQISQGDFFAMGSGPMRAAYGGEELFKHIGHTESSPVAVGVLESRQMPTNEVAQSIAESCKVEPANVTLLVAPTASLAGTIQVVARSVETSMHKLHELGFDLTRVATGFGSAPLPPVAKDDLAGIGLTNDAVLYGGEVTLWVHGDDASLEEIGPKVPSNASRDYGKPFIELFKQYDHDFYKIDPMLFSPAVVRFQNLDTGSTYSFGEVNADLLRQSQGG